MILHGREIKKPPRARRNDRGAYRAGVRAIEIDMPPAAEIAARVLLVHDPSVNAAPWRVGYRVEATGGRQESWGGHHAPPSPDGPGAATEAEAIRIGIEMIRDQLERLRRGQDLPMVDEAFAAVREELRRRGGAEERRELVARDGEAEIVAPMSALERRRLRACERTIERGLGDFIEVCKAMREIRDSRLYRETHARFEDYIRERFPIERAHAYRLIATAEIIEDIEKTSPIGDAPRPACEAQVRALLRVDKDQRAEVWKIACQRAAEAGMARPTAAIVAETVREWITPPDELDRRARQRAVAVEREATRSDEARREKALPDGERLAAAQAPEVESELLSALRGAVGELFAALRGAPADQRRDVAEWLRALAAEIEAIESENEVRDDRRRPE